MSAFLLSEDVSKIRLLTIGSPARYSFFLNPLIDFRGSNDASHWLMRLQCACHHLYSIGKHRLRKLLGLPLRRECFGLSSMGRESP
jgi:hypothetical protein